MWTLLAVLRRALFFYGIRDPAKGPGNLPPGGDPSPIQENGLPPPLRVSGSLVAGSSPRGTPPSRRLD
ncbi:hypothetical protein [Variovorax sp. OK605]|uniref:hypothetical protein n=1 Tax=Variovorax sp. OK605 TaxID=1855317 RepID=UPI000B86E9C7|nr:hypothetical protein [Variovorax sp. OK605]